MAYSKASASRRSSNFTDLHYKRLCEHPSLSIQRVLPTDTILQFWCFGIGETRSQPTILSSSPTRSRSPHTQSRAHIACKEVGRNVRQ